MILWINHTAKELQPGLEHIPQPVQEWGPALEGLQQVPWAELPPTTGCTQVIAPHKPTNLTNLNKLTSPSQGQPKWGQTHYLQQ